MPGRPFTRSLAGAWCVLVVAVLLHSGCEAPGQPEPPAGGKSRGPSPAVVFPERGAYTGAYIDFGEAEDSVTLDAIVAFEAIVGRHQAVIGSASFWGEQRFPRKAVEIISRHGAVPLIYWSPWDRPYAQRRGPDRFRLENILAGKWDAYIDQWADEARAYGRPLLVAWGLEMNGEWFPWSGCYYGGGSPVAQGGAKRYAGPALFVRAYRYVVDRVRARGADRILWGFHINNYSHPAEPWNAAAQYYPGPEHVDWLGLSVYGQQFRESGWISFAQAMDAPYREICEIDPVKPVIVAEWGVGEFPRSGSKAAWLEEAFASFTAGYPRLKAAVYWHERWQNEDGTYSNLRVNSSPESLAAYRRGVADPFWIDRPLLGPLPRESAAGGALRPTGR